MKYIDITKQFRAWAPKSHQILIAFEPVVNKLKWGANLLAKNPILVPPKPLWQLEREPRPQERPRKRLCIKNEVEHKVFVEVETPNNSLMKTEGPQDQLA